MSETKKESFRKYLEASGVIDSLTKGALVAGSCGLATASSDYPLGSMQSPDPTC